MHLILLGIVVRQRLLRSKDGRFAVLGALQGYSLPLEGMLHRLAEQRPMYLKSQLRNNAHWLEASSQ